MKQKIKFKFTFVDLKTYRFGNGSLQLVMLETPSMALLLSSTIFRFGGMLILTMQLVQINQKKMKFIDDLVV